MGYYQRAWQTSKDPWGKELTSLHSYFTERLDRHMRSMCIVLLRISIEQGQRSPPHLLLLSTLRSASDDGGTQRSQVCSRLAAACKVKDVRQGVSEYFEGFKAPEEAMVYVCESVGPYLTGLSEEPPAVPPPVHPPSAEDVEDMYYGCVEGTVLDKEWANVINNGGMTEFGIWQPRGGWKDSGMSLGAFRCYVRDG